MYTAFISNDPSQVVTSKEYGKALFIDTNSRDEVVSFFLFAMEHGKSFALLGTEDREISFDGIEEVDEGGED